MSDELPAIDPEAFEPSNYRAYQSGNQATSPLHASMQQATRKEDENLLVKFDLRMKPNGHDEHGAPLYKEVEYVDVRVPGKHDPIVRPARADDKVRWPRHYEAFKNRVAAPLEGYPLAEWSGIPRTMVETMAYFNIKTVEQLAGVSDGNCANIKGAIRFKIAAIDFLERLEGEGSSTQVAMELDDARQTITAQQAQIDDLNDKLNLVIQQQKDTAEKQTVPAEVSETTMVIDEGLTSAAPEQPKVLKELPTTPVTRRRKKVSKK